MSDIIWRDIDKGERPEYGQQCLTQSDDGYRTTSAYRAIEGFYCSSARWWVPLQDIPGPHGLAARTIDDVDARQVIERCADALANLGACEVPDCPEPNCNHALPLAIEWLRKKEDEG